MNYNNELYHYGVKGQKWGVRRYQNKDGTLTDAGKKRTKESDEKSKKTHAAVKLGAEVAGSLVYGTLMSGVVKEAGYGYGTQLAASLLGGWLGMTTVDTLFFNDNK